MAFIVAFVVLLIVVLVFYFYKLRLTCNLKRDNFSSHVRSFAALKQDNEGFMPCPNVSGVKPNPMKCDPNDKYNHEGCAPYYLRCVM